MATTTAIETRLRDLEELALSPSVPDELRRAGSRNLVAFRRLYARLIARRDLTGDPFLHGRLSDALIQAIAETNARLERAQRASSTSQDADDATPERLMDFVDHVREEADEILGPQIGDEERPVAGGPETGGSTAARPRPAEEIARLADRLSRADDACREAARKADEVRDACEGALAARVAEAVESDLRDRASRYGAVVWRATIGAVLVAGAGVTALVGLVLFGPAMSTSNLHATDVAHAAGANPFLPLYIAILGVGGAAVVSVLFFTRAASDARRQLAACEGRLDAVRALAAAGDSAQVRAAYGALLGTVDDE